jgi:AAA15 family ATPase/GTPase
MLIEFRLKNFRSFAAERRISMVAGAGKELADQTIKAKGFESHPLLRSAAIFGANASGKSNLINAFLFMRSFIILSSGPKIEGGKIPVTPFRLDERFDSEPSEFEITFLREGIRHQYGFVVSPDRVIEEWLIVYPNGKKQEWFHRTNGENGGSKWYWSRPHFKGDKTKLAERTRSDALFLTVAAQWNHLQIKPIHDWFINHLSVAPKNVGAMGFTLGKLNTDPSFCDWASDIVRSADFGIDHLIAKERDPINPEKLVFADEIPDSFKDFLKTSLIHDSRINNELKIAVNIVRRINGGEKEVVWDLSNESDGTKRMLELLGPIYSVLSRRMILIVDEIDTSLHAYLTRALVRLFNDPATNPNCAQLIFTTHDTTLLDTTLFRRDQIWFTQKDESGATDLFSLHDFSPRIDEAIQKGYLVGRYGAIPDLKRFSFPEELRLTN